MEEPHLEIQRALAQARREGATKAIITMDRPSKTATLEDNRNGQELHSRTFNINSHPATVSFSQLANEIREHPAPEGLETNLVSKYFKDQEYSQTLHPKPITKVANMPKQARFYIDVPTGQVDLLEQTLLSAGLQFCPFDNMVHLPRENLLDSIFTGKEGQYAIDKVNEKLEELDRPERINLEFHQMTPETRWDLLAFVTMEMDWESEYQPEIQSLDPDRVTQFLSEHPETAVPQELK